MILAVKVWLVAWLVTHNDYIQSAIDNLLFMSSRISTDLLLEVFGCWKCLSFWSVLIFTQDIFLALFFSLLAYVIDKRN